MEINGFTVDQFNVHGIPVKAKTSTCPKCSSTRKKKNDKCMSVFWDTGLGQCNHCGETIQLHTYKSKTEVIVYEKPKEVKESLSEKVKTYFKSRAISDETIKHFRVGQGSEWMPQTKKEENCILFNYFYDNQIINIKYRDGNKNFKLYKGAEKILYNLDSIKGNDFVVFVEGEFDAMSVHEAGISSVVSVPNGFNLKGNISLDYLDGYAHLFQDLKKIIIAVDNDEAGRKGQEELVRRFGSDVCELVDFGDCKDANGYLIRYGKDKLKELIENSKPVKIEGVFYLNDVKASMLDSYKNGQKRGSTTYIPELDKAWTWREGETTIWTGYQNEGKSLMLNQLCAIRAYWEDAKVAVFSPENMPLDDFYNDIIEMYIGKSCDPYYSNNYMTKEEYAEGMEFVNENFFLIYPEKDFTIESIFERTRYLVKTKGIRTLIIDPYNTVEHKMRAGEREDLYISRFMAQLKRNNIEQGISTHLVAHQLTPRKNEKDGNRYYKPDLNSIKGGGTFADKADNVNFVWRPNRAIDFRDREVIFGSQKIKKQKLVGIPQDVPDITFDVRQNRYLFNGITPFTKIAIDRKGLDFAEEPEPITKTPNEAFNLPVEDLEDSVPF